MAATMPGRLVRLSLASIVILCSPFLGLLLTFSWRSPVQARPSYPRNGGFEVTGLRQSSPLHCPQQITIIKSRGDAHVAPFGSELRLPSRSCLSGHGPLGRATAGSRVDGNG